MTRHSPSPHLKPHFLIVPLLIAALVLAGCNVPCCGIPTFSPPAYSPTASTTPFPGNATLTAKTPTPLTVPASPTSTSTSTASPTVLPATATTVLVASSTPMPSSINGGDVTFTTETTATVMQGTVNPGQTIYYHLNAAQSQPMVLILDSPNKDVTLGVFEPHGTMLLDPAKKLAGWQGVLPYDGLYTILVTGGASTENYTLTVKIAQLIHFAAGQSSTSLTGITKNGYLFSYGLECSAGQSMTASLTAPANTLHLDIFGIGGSTLLSNAANATTWSGVLPQTDTYVVEVVPNAGQEINYLLAVSCTGMSIATPTATTTAMATATSIATPTATTTAMATATSIATPTASATALPSTAGSIIFAPGTTAAVNKGTIQHGEMQIYTVATNQFQPLILRVESPRNDVTLGVLSPSGSTFLDPAKKYSYWRWQLPESGLYTIQVIGGAVTENYTLTTKVGQLVAFPAGSHSITLSDYPYKGYVHDYAIRLSAGVILTASLNVDSSKAYLIIFGMETGALLDRSAKATSWTGTLPMTQEYIVEVVPQSVFLGNYTLTLSIP